MTPDMMSSPISTGRKLARRPRLRRPSCRCTSRCTGSGPTSSAVVHAHPPIATGFAVAGIPLDRAVLAEVVTTLGSIPIAEYATPSTEELPEAVRQYIKAHDGMLLANHGALTRRRRAVRRVLQDGDDRALREDQPGRAAARRRAPALARGGAAAPGAARACTASPRRRRSAPTTLAGAGESCQVVRAPDAPGPAARARGAGRGADARPDAARTAGRRRGNSVNIPRTHGPHRGRRAAVAVAGSSDAGQRTLAATLPRYAGLTAASADSVEAVEWVRHSGWSRPRVSSR